MARKDDDDAPWLAEAGGRPRTEVSRRSLFWTLVTGLGLATVVAVGLVLLFTRKDTGSTQGYMNAEQAPLITAEPGPYKIPPADPKGLQVDGEGQTIYAAGEGIDPGSVIDTSALPEAPLPRPGTAPLPGTQLPPGPPTDLLSATAPADPAAPATEPPKAVAKPPANPPVSTAKPMVPPPVPTTKPPTTTAKPGGIVQLGAFSSPEKAEEAWAKLAARHGLTGKRIIAVTANGKTLYRLRSSGDAAAICARLKAAGDPCAVVE
jgi:hypothetical protein